MACMYDGDFQLAPGVLYSSFVDSLKDGTVCPETYLRPDPGGALIPFLYALFLLLFHLPSVVIRAVKWESAQYLALALACLSVALCIQSFESTKLAPEQVLVWMPLALIQDVGAMLQMVVLILERHGIAALGTAVEAATKKLVEIVIQGFSSRNASKTPDRLTSRQEPPLNDVGIADCSPLAFCRQADAHWTELNQVRRNTSTDLLASEDIESARANSLSEEQSDVLRHAIVAFVAFFFLLALIILQVYGLYAAIQGLKHKDLTVKWCSPSFRDFAVAITTGNCEKYEIIPSTSNGIGCIALPAQQQHDWLIGTVICLSAALIFQIMDMCLLRCAKGRKCRGGVTMQRPWLTMFSGVLVLVILISFGVFNSNRLPPGVTSKVWIYRKEGPTAVGRVCQGTLTSPGLRGMIIGWTDGLFNNWGDVYFGNRLQ